MRHPMRAPDGADDCAYTSVDELLALRKAGMQLPFLHPRAVRQRRVGEQRSRERGRGIEFEDVRAYQAGDDLRHIAWRLTARAGKPYTRLHAQERERECFLAIDQRACMFFGARHCFKSVQAARAAALLAWSAVASGHRFGALVAAREVHPLRYQPARAAALQLIALLASCNRQLDATAPAGPDLGAILQACATHSRSGSAVVILSDFSGMDTAAAQRVHALAQSRTVLLLQIVDPLEVDLPLATVGVSDGRERASVHIGKALQSRYRKGLEATELQLANCAERAGVVQHRLGTEEDALRALGRILQRG